MKFNELRFFSLLQPAMVTRVSTEPRSQGKSTVLKQGQGQTRNLTWVRFSSNDSDQSQKQADALGGWWWHGGLTLCWDIIQDMGQNRPDESNGCQMQSWNGWTGQQSGRKTKGKLVHQYAGWHGWWWWSCQFCQSFASWGETYGEPARRGGLLLENTENNP